MLHLLVATAEVSVAAIIVTPVLRVLVLPSGAIDDATVEQVNMLLSAAARE